jgi:amino-acid N-acetyltransferase
MPTYRSARPHDIPAIVSLIDRYAAERIMLRKTPEAIALALDDFVVAVDGHGRLLGCGAVREYSPSVAEVSSVAVAPAAQGLGVGSAVVRRVERLARARGISELFALTTTPSFFRSLGYRVVDRTLFPEKIRRDCVSCALRSACAEICVYRALADVTIRAA